MNPTSDRFRRRLAVAARAPSLSAPQLLQLEGLGPDLSALDQPDRAALARLGLSTGTIDWLATPDEALIAQDLRWLDASGTVLLPATTTDYPPLLRESPDAPGVLYVRGDVRILSEPQLAMVGSRNPTAGGRATAREFAMFFANAGITITSGLALGIDTACHEGALAVGGPTVAVLGCGLDQIYPRENQALADRIAATGALITEFPPGSSPLPAYFP